MCGTVPCPILQGVFAPRHNIRVVVGRKHAFKIGHGTVLPYGQNHVFCSARLSQSDLRTYGSVSTHSLLRLGGALIPLEPESGALSFGKSSSLFALFARAPHSAVCSR